MLGRTEEKNAKDKPGCLFFFPLIGSLCFSKKIIGSLSLLISQSWGQGGGVWCD